MINGIPAAQYLDYREKVLPFLSKFAELSLGRATVESLEAAIGRRERQVWAINEFQAVCVTSLSPESVNIDFAAGVRRHEWQQELDEEMRKWARALGKKRVIAHVRPGWSKWGNSRGYKEAYREMVLEI